jgi:NAD(P)-dependent dehydrogenase (short-subunit alcohol dehydrogenase family)
VSFAQYPSLTDRSVFITGGGSGIGAAMVAAFAAQGARVAFVDIDEAGSLSLVEGLGDVKHQPVFLRCDLTDVRALQSAMNVAREKVGPFAALVNNAANDQRQAADDVSETDWDAAIAVNLKHQFFAAQLARRWMVELGGGSIINFSSTAFLLGIADLSVYSAAKAAVIGMTKSLAREFGPDGVRVNALLPGAVITERQRRLWLNEDEVKAVVARQCLARILEADEIARMALFLAADDSRMITKQTFIVDAGIS